MYFVWVQVPSAAPQREYFGTLFSFICYFFESKCVVLLLSTANCKIDYLSCDDFSDVIYLFTNSNVRQYLGGVISCDEALEKLNKWIHSTTGKYFVVRDHNGVFIAVISFSLYENNNIEVSYQFMPQFWGKGVAFEALLAVLDFCKIEFGFSEIYAETQSNNLRSCKLLEKIGFRHIRSVIRFDEEQSVYYLKF